MQNLVKKLGNLEILKCVFKDEYFLLKRDLRNSKNVLDLGCGSDSPIKFCSVPFSVGVDVNKHDIRIARSNKIHDKYINKNILKLKFSDKSFDSVMLVGVLEHLSKKDANLILDRVEKWVSKKIIISVPNGWTKQDGLVSNRFQKHLSSWEVLDFIKRGYKVYGITGAKFMYEENMDIKFDKNEDKFSFRNLKYTPKWLFFIINAFLEILVYHRPTYAKTLYAVKNIKE